jgi:hypothetical protein
MRVQLKWLLATASGIGGYSTLFRVGPMFKGRFLTI